MATPLYRWCCQLFWLFVWEYSGHGTGVERLWIVPVPYFFVCLPWSITPMEQVEQAQLTSMKIYNTFVSVLCFKNMLQKVLC